MLPVKPKRTESVITRSGIRLDADVYYPDAEGTFPVLLMRQPYGRAIASTVTYAHPQWYAAHGYIVVIQDVRGRGTSEGKFDLFAHEVDDGVDTVAWAAQRPGSTGDVGMYGFSYQGMTQLFAAAGQPPALKTICPAMVAYDLYADWAYEGNAFCLFGNQAWAMQLAAETVRRQGNEEDYTTLYAAAHRLEIADPVNVQCKLLQQHAPSSFYHDWLHHSDAQDLYWATRSPKTYIDQLNLPMLHVGGWYDTHLRGTIKLYEAMCDRSTQPQHLWIGPWAHLPWGQRVGTVDFGVSANSPIDQIQVRWFDHILKGINTGLLDQPPVNLFEMGRNRWRSFAKFPSESSQVFYLHSDGLASLDLEAGAIALAPDSETHPDVIVHDPWRPVPSVGGHAVFPSGPANRAAIDSRSDILTYTSEVLAQHLHVTGKPTVELYAEADTPSFDLCVVLSEVSPTGAVMHVTQGYRRIETSSQLETSSQSSPYTLSFQPICHCFKRGNTIRLSISGACVPAYSVNPGTGKRLNESRLIDAKVITVQIYRDSDRPSCLHLPLVSTISPSQWA